MQMPAAPQPQRVAVIGGGVAGLAAAHRLRELKRSVDVTLFEAGSRLGGVLQTVCEDGFLWERSADNFITNVPWATDLCRRLGLDDELLPTDERHRQAFVVHRGRLAPIPPGFLVMAPTQLGPMLTTPILSFRGKLRLAWERFVPPRRDETDESLASFAVRRFGRETYERLIQPLVGGIYTADPQRLSIQATMPRFVALERRHGSLLRGLRTEACQRRASATEDSGARYSLFMTLRTGLSRLVDALAERLPPDCVQRNARVERIERRPSGWRVITTGPSPPTRDDFDAAIVATPATQAARLLASLDDSLARELAAIPFAGCAIAVLGYRREQIGHPLDGFGFVVPLVERRRILSASFSSVKYPGRAPHGHELIRVFLGGACQIQLLDLADEELVRAAQDELADLLHISGPPRFVRLCRWPNAMPQYHVGHVDRVRRIESAVARHPGLALAGNAFHGVGIPQCIHSGEQAAERLMAMPSTTPPRSLSG